MEFLMTSYSPLLLLAYSPVAAVTSLKIPFSDWLNETVSKMRLNLLLNNVSSVKALLRASQTVYESACDVYVDVHLYAIMHLN